MGGFFARFRQKKEAPIWSAVVVAAGSARRMEGIDKIRTPIGGIPVLVHTLRAFQDCPAICEVIVVTREDLLVEIGQICRDFALDKVKKVIVGGSERMLSVQNGLQEVRRDAQLIAIHDGARPFLSQQVLMEVLETAAKTGAAAPAVPLVDTIKRVQQQVAVETVDRSTLMAVQTPQVFQADLIRAAIQKAITDGEMLTDDCGAVERMGMKVTMTTGSRENIKLTTPLDVTIGEAILQARGQGFYG